MPKADKLVIWQGAICLYSTIKWFLDSDDLLEDASKEDVKKWLKQQ